MQCFSGLFWDQGVDTLSVSGIGIFVFLLNWAKEGSRGFDSEQAGEGLSKKPSIGETSVILVVS